MAIVSVRGKAQEEHHPHPRRECTHARPRPDSRARTGRRAKFEPARRFARRSRGGEKIQRLCCGSLSGSRPSYVAAHSAGEARGSSLSRQEARSAAVRIQSSSDRWAKRRSALRSRDVGLLALDIRGRATAPAGAQISLAFTRGSNVPWSQNVDCETVWTKLVEASEPGKPDSEGTAAVANLGRGDGPLARARDRSEVESG